LLGVHLLVYVRGHFGHHLFSFVFYLGLVDIHPGGERTYLHFHFGYLSLVAGFHLGQQAFHHLFHLRSIPI
jgi:hypothetical protein